jgi:hypothetical protein
MSRINVLILYFFTFFTFSDLYGINYGFSGQFPIEINHQDTLRENQVLYNGRIWRNLYFLVQGDQFLFSKEFLPGSVSISGKTFTNIDLKYDIFKDEILTPSDTGGILQLNKELVDSFAFSFQYKIYRFIRIKDDSLKRTARYFNVLYKGKTALYEEYNKKIEKQAVEGMYDKFYQVSRVYFVKKNKFYMITRKNDLLKILDDEKEQINNFIKKSKLKVSEKTPESFIPVIRYYDCISK